MPEIRTYDHQQGNLLPNPEHSESERPNARLLTAPWLPIDEAGGELQAKFVEYYVMMPGKIAALSRDGYACPAGLSVKIRAAGASDVVLQYTAKDKANKVLSLYSGVEVADSDIAANGSTGWYKSDIETALKSRGVLRSNETLDDFVSAPVGVVPYGYWQAPSNTGEPTNPAKRRYHNWNLQHRVAIVCDYVLSLPLVPETKSSVSLINLGTFATSTKANVYQLSFTDVNYMPFALSTLSAPWSWSNDSASLFTTQKNKLRGVRAAGDYFIDENLQKIYFYHTSTVLATATNDAGPVTPSFYHYNSTSDANIATQFACVVGNPRPGDYLKPTAKSNWIPVTQADDRFALANTSTGDLSGGSYDASKESDINGKIDELQASLDGVAASLVEHAQIIGQVLSYDTYPKQGLELVRSYGSYSSNMRDKVPGSATEGLTDKITYSGAANKHVIVNIIKR